MTIEKIEQSDMIFVLKINEEVSVETTNIALINDTYNHLQFVNRQYKMTRLFEGLQIVKSDGVIE